MDALLKKLWQSLNEEGFAGALKPPAELRFMGAEDLDDDHGLLFEIPAS